MAAWGSMVPWNAIIEGNTDTYTNQTGTQTTQKALTQEGLNKLIYDAFSSDSGLASLSSGENLSGGFGSSVKSQLAQDMVIKVAGELANITAPTTVSTSSDTDQDKQSPIAKGIGTVICTHLMKRGLLNKDLWKAGTPYLLSLPNRTVIGYQFWAEAVVSHMERNPNGWMERFWTPIVRGRYQMVVNKKFNFLGASTIYLMEPICYVIGFLLGVSNGRYANAV